MEKYDIPLQGHSVAVVINGNISEDTLKAYAETFIENKLNYAFVGQHPKKISEDFGITETYNTAHPTLFDSLIVLSDGTDINPNAEAFAELNYKHGKPLVVNSAVAKGLSDAKINLEAPGVFISDKPQVIIQAFKKVRYWDR